MIAYKILEIAGGKPSFSDYKEATVTGFDEATGVISLKARNLESIPLDGRYLDPETEKQHLMDQTDDVAWAMMAEIKCIEK